MALKIGPLSHSYGQKLIFDQFEIAFEPDKINCILGPSGCGKTTLLNLIYATENQNITFSRIYQEPRLLPWKTVFENILFVKNALDQSQVDEVEDLIVQIKLFNDRNALPHTLSGGMQQRVSIARAYAYHSDVILMDEPFKGLDVNLKERIIALFLRLWEKQKRTVIFVTHDLEEAYLLAQKLFVLTPSPVKIVSSSIIDTPLQSRDIDTAAFLAFKTELRKLL